MLIIELDGSQHLDQEDYDWKRTQYLESQGYKVIRFWNNDVMNTIEGVLSAIHDALETAPQVGGESISTSQQDIIDL